MRHLLCRECMNEKQPGTRQIYPRSAIGEPAEYERIVVGVARRPAKSQRWIAVNGEKEYLSTDFFNCDSCDAKIKPGDPCGAQTVWTETTGQISPWEHEYIELDKKRQNAGHGLQA